MTVKVRKISDPLTFCSVENMRKTYATMTSAERAVEGKIASWHLNATATIVVTTNADRRYVPVVVWQGDEACQGCINSASAGFLSFA